MCNLIDALRSLATYQMVSLEGMDCPTLGSLNEDISLHVYTCRLILPFYCCTQLSYQGLNWGRSVTVSQETTENRYTFQCVFDWLMVPQGCIVDKRLVR